MIDKAEIDAKSAEFEIHPSKVQRDYVFGWLLHGLFTASALKDQLFLKGGNALRKGYFANTRFSGDLDFGIPGDVQETMLLSEINKVCTLIQDKAGVRFVTERNNVKEKFAAAESPLTNLKVYEVRIYFKDFYGNAEHIDIRISMDLTRFDKALLPLQSVNLIHPYSDAQEAACAIRCMKLEEIIASKLKCLIQRQHPPDLFDYALSIKLLGGTLDKGEVVKTLIRKTIFSRNPFVLKGILLSTAFDYFRSEWANSVVCAKQFIINADEAIAAFISDLEVLFAQYTDNGYARFTYFEAKYRAPIMHAARTQTLLKIRYKGADRIVEPYSLKYLQRQGGQEREYFYVWNQSGGDNEPGIRMFVPENIQSIENTETTFQPRYVVELCKAGEMPEDRYLFDPNRPARVLRVRLFGSSRKRSTRGVTYIYECTHCSRTFTRSTRNPVLRSHKDKQGYNCHGTRGYYVDTRYS